jgi:DNA-binding MarR family transcriptional regulator
MPGKSGSGDPGGISDAQAVMNSLRQIVHALETGSRAAQKSVGLSGAQLLVLQMLEGDGVTSLNELAHKSHTHQSSVSVVVSRLAEAGLVKRAPAADDARRLQLSVTAAGRKALQAGFVTPQERLMASLRRIAPERVGDLRLLLDELVALSGFEAGTPPMFLEDAKQSASSAQAAAVPSKSKHLKT